MVIGSYEDTIKTSKNGVAYFANHEKRVGTLLSDSLNRYKRPTQA